MGRTVTVIKSDEDDAGLISYYCLRCGKDTMLLSAHLGTYPRRQTDGAYVVDDEAIKSINVATGQVRNILRMNRGAERQHRMDCQMCGTSVAYRSTEIDNVHNERTYVFPGILSCNPTISLDSLDADELAVPEAIGSETVNDQSMVTVKMDITFGAHTLVQVSDVTTKVLMLQLKSSLKDNELKINEAVLQFFMKLLGAEKADVQLLETKRDGLKRVGLAKVSCGFVYAKLLAVMIDMQYVLPKIFAERDAQVYGKRKREEEKA